MPDVDAIIPSVKADFTLMEDILSFLAVYGK
jgi:hypothetical protein